MARTVYRCAVGTRVFAWAVIVGGVAALAGLALMLVEDLGSPPVVITLMVLAVLGIAYLWRFALHPRVEVDDRLWVVNPMRTHILEPAEVTDVTPGPNGLLVSHPDGIIEAWAVQKSTRALNRDTLTRADRVAEDILRGLGRVRQSSAEADVVPEPEADAVPEPAPEAVPEPEPMPDPEEDRPAGAPDDLLDDLIIRRAHPDDLDQLVALEHSISAQALAHIFPSGQRFPTEAITARWSSVLGDRAYKVRMAEIDGEPVGYLCYGTDELHHVGLLPSHSGQGLGRALVEYAMEDMAARGATTVRLQVLEDNRSAREFYTHLGWCDTGRRTPCEHPPHPIELTMTRPLDPTG